MLFSSENSTFNCLSNWITPTKVELWHFLLRYLFRFIVISAWLIILLFIKRNICISTPLRINYPRPWTLYDRKCPAMLYYRSLIILLQQKSMKSRDFHSPSFLKGFLRLIIFNGLSNIWNWEKTSH